MFARPPAPRRVDRRGALNRQAMRSFAAALAFVALVAGRAVAEPCSSASGIHGSIAPQIAHVYNQIATDADVLPASYDATLDARNGEFSVALQTDYSRYDSQHAGASTATVVHTIAGPTVSVPWFVASDRTSTVHVGACTHLLRLYAGIGYVQTQSSYGYPYGYGPLRGAGAGLERFAEPARRFDAFGSLYYYPAAAGAYGSGSVSYALLSFHGGLRWRLGGSGLGLIVGLDEEMRTLRPGMRSGFMISDGPFVGLDF